MKMYITLFVILVPAVLGYHGRVPIKKYANLCTDMVPFGHNNGTSLANDTDSPPFTISTNADSYTAGGSLTVNITVKGDILIGGFFIQARRADLARDTNVAVGTFAYPPPDTALLECHSVNNSAWGHTNDTGWKTLLGVWNAPVQDEGPLQFRATIVLAGKPSRSYFYLGVTSSQLSFMAGPAMTVETPEEPVAGDGTTSASTTSTACTPGASFALGVISLISGLTFAKRL
ncbi:putative ferric-chelate reductase 1 [Asterias rubens]|uniref:putative ferric-chelate reductase 1 n=1 Tax=Asterias rubens TaxID=7604 RepID=UPI0014555E11|nr:putative ferric-chelate reductase 1 [Asterias rubens]